MEDMDIGCDSWKFKYNNKKKVSKDGWMLKWWRWWEKWGLNGWEMGKWVGSFRKKIKETKSRGNI